MLMIRYVIFGGVIEYKYGSISYSNSS